MYESDRLKKLENRNQISLFKFQWILLKIWKTNDRDWSNIFVEQLRVALRIISARLAQAITNRDTRFLK